MFGTLSVLSLWAARVDAGCGCDKPPPGDAAVRPSFAWAGSTIRLFSRALEANKIYKVKFHGADSNFAVSAAAVAQRDLAGGVVKPQIVVTVPAVPLGPTRVVVSRNGEIVLNVPKTDFTVLQAPIALAETDGVTIAKCYRAAVGADGTMYLPLDITAISRRAVFSGFAEGYPVLFDADDIVFYNSQGFLMQLLGPAETGIYEIEDPGTPNSFALTYDRHEFVTYKSEHVHEGEYALDPTDPNWHMNGTRHIDHDHLVLAIRGTVENSGAPTPGQTPPFNLNITQLIPDGAFEVPTRTILWNTECLIPINSGDSGGW